MLVIVALEEGLKNLMKHEKVEFLMYPVDYHQFPDYLNLVAYPMCLDMMYARLVNGFYRRIEV